MCHSLGELGSCQLCRQAGRLAWSRRMAAQCGRQCGLGSSTYAGQRGLFNLKLMKLEQMQSSVPQS